MTPTPGSLEFLELVRRVVVNVSARTGKPVSIGWLAKRWDLDREDVEAAMIHLKDRGEIGWTKRRRGKKCGTPG